MRISSYLYKRVLSGLIRGNGLLPLVNGGQGGLGNERARGRGSGNGRKGSLDQAILQSRTKKARFCNQLVMNHTSFLNVEWLY